VHFLAETDPEKILNTLRVNSMTHICVEKSRVYVDRTKVVGFGYPRSFVERLPTLPFLERVEGGWLGIELWRVKGETGGEAPVPPSGAKP
jgi:hypothetical protein